MYGNPSFDTGALRIRLKAAEDKVKAFELQIPAQWGTDSNLSGAAIPD